jgi:hypothetical protein
MANTILTPTAVTRAVAVVLHQKAKFLNRVNQQYDAQYSVNGQRKGGGSIKIRLPNEYTVRTGATMNVQDTSEISETLTIGTMKGVDMAFTDSDLALSIEDFSKRIIEPAVKALVSNIEADIIVSATDAVANFIDKDGSALAFVDVFSARQKLVENLAPDDDDDLSLFLSPTHVTKYIDAVKGLFVPASALSKQYADAMLGKVAGVGWVGTSTHLTNHLTGTAVKTTTYLTDIAAGEENGSAGLLHIDTGTTTFKAGDRITIESVNAVHPETKASLGYLKQFVVTADFAGGEGDLAISPSIIATGARQNVDAAAADGKAITKLGAAASEYTNRSVYFHRDFCAVAFADLENPRRYGAWGDTQVVDGISCRVWQQGDIVNGRFLSRIDVLYGHKVIRPQLACVIHADG